MAAREVSEFEFIRVVTQAGSHMMWFLGAGASRSSGLPTAADVTWDLKRKYYCAHQNQDVLAHDVSNKAIQRQIQSYMDSRGFPPLWDAREYSFYFEQIFGTDYSSQQKYLSDVLSTAKISSTIGHRALAALLHMDRARIIFTTNFDEVIETAFAAITGQSLTAFHIEGAYAAIDALNSDQFPFCVKLHGDFRYQSIKNLSNDLRSNDARLQKCLIAAAARFGMIVTGYSGRDHNVMSMFRQAIDQNNAFPHGLFWTAPSIAGIAPAVHELLDHARQKGILSGVVQSGTFDEMLSKIWMQTPNRPTAIDTKVRTAIQRPVSIKLPSPGREFPLLRTNALLITKTPIDCGVVDYGDAIDMTAVRSKAFEERVQCTFAKGDRFLFWGPTSELKKILDTEKIRSVEKYAFENLPELVDESGHIKAFLEETLVNALVSGKPIAQRKDGRTWYAVVKHDQSTDMALSPLRQALGRNGSLAPVHGMVPGLADVYWSEAAGIRIEERNGLLWLLVRPEIWISPLKERVKATDFLRTRKLKRYNQQAYEVLNAWIRILLGELGQGLPVTAIAFPDSEFPAQFEVGTRTAYSKRSASNG